MDNIDNDNDSNVMSQKVAPRISVVIPLFNKEAHIADTIKSIINQTMSAFEIIVVDDGSTDKGPEIAAGFDKVRVIKQENGGVSRARNMGVSHSRGDFVAFIDADDEWLPHFLEEIIHLICTFPKATIFTTGYQFCIDNGKFQQPKIRLTKPTTQPHILTDYFAVGAKGALPFVMSSIAVNKLALNKIGLFPVDEPMGEDQDFFCRAALKGTIAYTPRILALYHLETTNRACVNNIPDKECPFSLRLRDWAETESNEELKEDIYLYCAAHIIYLASLNVRAGNFSVAYKLLQEKITYKHQLKRTYWLARCKVSELFKPKSAA